MSQTWRRISTRLSIELERRRPWQAARAGRNLGSERFLEKKTTTGYVYQLELVDGGSEILVDLNVLWEQIVAVGAVVEHDLVEGGGAEFLHLAVVIAAIFVFTDHPLSNCQISHRCLVPLEERSNVLLWLW